MPSTTRAYDGRGVRGGRLSGAADALNLAAAELEKTPDVTVTHAEMAAWLRSRVPERRSQHPPMEENQT